MEFSFNKVPGILNWIRLENFRGFKDTGVINIAPINILVGANSSGKSSILKFFPLLKQSVNKRINGVFKWFGDDVDFGDFKNTVTEGEKTITINMGFDDFSVSFTVCENKNQDHTDMFKSITIKYQNNLIEKVFKTDDFDSTNKLSFFPRLFDDMQYFSNKKKHSTQEINLLYKSNDNVSHFSNSIVYVKPIRAKIERFYRYTNDDTTEIFSDGSNLPMFLNNLDKESLTDLKKWLQNNFGFSIELKKSEGNIEILIVEEGCKARNAVDMGFGYSEMLPILAIVWKSQYATSRKLNLHLPLFIVIEQPELHLHPKFQAKFAQVMCNVVKKIPYIHFFVETHSQTIINALGTEIDLGKAKREDVNILLVNKNKGISTITKSGFDKEGYLINWPIDFLDEYAY